MNNKKEGNINNAIEILSNFSFTKNTKPQQTIVSEIYNKSTAKQTKELK